MVHSRSVKGRHLIQVVPSKLFRHLKKGRAMAKAKGKDRPSILVPVTILPSFERFACAKQICDKAEARMKAEAGIINETLIESFADSLAKLRCKPANPRLTVFKDNKPDIEGLFQVQEKFYPTADEECQGTPKIRLISALVKAGLTTNVAESIVTNEISCEEKEAIRPLSDLKNGAPVERELGEKLSKLLKDNFNADELSLIMKQDAKFEVKDGFFERLALYVGTKEGIMAVLKVLKPTHFLSHLKVGVGESPMGVINRLYAAAKDLLYGSEVKAA
jgi:hypothetical protein